MALPHCHIKWLDTSLEEKMEARKIKWVNQIPGCSSGFQLITIGHTNQRCTHLSFAIFKRIDNIIVLINAVNHFGVSKLVF